MYLCLCNVLVLHGCTRLKNTLTIRKAIRDYPGATDPLFTSALDEFRQRTGRMLAYDRDMGATGLSTRQGTPEWGV